MKKRVAITLILTLLLTMFVPIMASAQIAAEEVDITAEGAVVMDASTGQILYDKNMNQLLFPASMTKVMTALVVLENLDPNNTIVTVTSNAVGLEGSSLGLKEGEQLIVMDLLYGLMLKSTNDAAFALAETCGGGDVNLFIQMMNEKAAALGCQNTNFVTPNGLQNDNHYTTPYDMALIMKAAIANDTLREIMGTEKYVMPATNLSEPREVVNSNRLLADDTEVEINGVMRTYRYDDLVCGKTGFTNAAQYCLVEYAERDNLGIIAVTMKSTLEEQYPDSIKLMDAVFDRYEGVRLIKEGAPITQLYVKNGGKADVTVQDPIVACSEKNGESSLDDYTWDVVPYEDLVAPIKAGTEVGTLTLKYKNEAIAAYPVTTMGDVEVSFFHKIIDSFKGSIISKLILVAVIFLVALIIAGRLMLRPNKKRRAKRKKKRAGRQAESDARIEKRSAQREAKKRKAKRSREESERRATRDAEKKVRSEQARKREEAERALAESQASLRAAQKRAGKKVLDNKKPE